MFAECSAVWAEIYCLGYNFRTHTPPKYVFYELSSWFYESCNFMAYSSDLVVHKYV